MDKRWLFWKRTEKVYQKQRRNSQVGSLICFVYMHAQLCLTLCNSMDGSHQAPLSMGWSRQKHWCGLSFPPPGYLPDPGTEPQSPASPALASRFSTTEPPGTAYIFYTIPLISISTKRQQVTDDSGRIHLQCRRPELNSWIRNISWKWEWLPSPVSLPGEFHRQRSLACYSPKSWLPKSWTGMSN